MSLQNDKSNILYMSPISATEDAALIKMPFSYEELSSVLSYDPETGSFTWRVMVSTQATAGSSAGTWLMAERGKKYLSITYKGRKMTASQVAWLLHYKEWPGRSLQYVDRDPGNLRISNLQKAAYVAERIVNDEGVTRYKMGKEQVRHYGLARNYGGMTLTQYAEMFAEQDGCCAICKKPETAKIPGRKTESSDSGIRDLSVDHDHETGVVRQLLCNACNHMLGHAADDPQRLRAAADYLEFHRKARPSLTVVRASPD